MGSATECSDLHRWRSDHDCCHRAAFLHMYAAGTLNMTSMSLTISADAGRVLTGLACGALTATVPSYIAELSISSIRGIMTGLFEVAYQVGSLVGFWINYGINNHMSPTDPASWRVPMAVQLIPAVPLFVCGFLLHESPLWLMRKGKVDQAHKALEGLRKIPANHPCE